ncbi:TetR family transcriptional regulator [Paenibacillus athensensis]|uniref:HTH tetR-type domain-containing protein n=1 Tax=Paenibacillus athensensis TaxID=1967502 RepID=A0A4Y8QAW4_9BACL|nr:TetR family transcriptional regulator [Paenibacillus athensensis]MCD1260126.1 TetR family transcriptional regulator [Paenibacillus athensensis]
MSPKVTEEHKEQRRKQILAAAERVFIRTGYEPATLKDIVEEAAMSRGWIYLYFQSKEEIFEALAEQYDREANRALETLLTQPLSVWEMLEAMLTGQKADLAGVDTGLQPVFHEYFLTGWRDAGRRRRLVQRYAQGVARFVRLLEAGAERGEFAPSLPLELIAQIAASHIEGIMTHALALGAQQAAAAEQIDALTAYLKSLLNVQTAEKAE